MLNKSDAELLDMLFNTFKKMCDFIEESDEIGCIKCPCKEDCVLIPNDSDFPQFQFMVENIKKKLKEQ